MKSIILVAGIGERFKELKIPKSLLLIGQKTLIQHTLTALSHYGIKESIIVTGHLENKIKEHLGDSYSGISIKYITNPNYANTHTMHSLYQAKDLINDDILLIEGDLLFDYSLIEKIIFSEHKNLIVGTPLKNLEEGVLISSKENPKIDKIGRDIKFKNIIGEYVGISKLSRKYLGKVFNFFEEEYMQKGKTDYYENVFVEFSKKYKELLFPFIMENLTWTDIDNKDDLKMAKKEIFPKLNFD